MLLVFVVQYQHIDNWILFYNFVFFHFPQRVIFKLHSYQKVCLYLVLPCYYIVIILKSCVIPHFCRRLRL